MSVWFLLCVIGAGSEVYAQNKDACELVSKADIEAVVGQSLYGQSQNPQRCAYTNMDPGTDYESELNSLAGKLGPQIARPAVYLIPEDRAKISIISHCKAMTMGYPALQPFLTSDELAALMSVAGQAKTKAEVLACMKEYDAKEISANRKAAVEYCFQQNDYTKGSSYTGSWFDYCMNRHDMLQAMCSRVSAVLLAYQKRKNPHLNYVAQPCPGVRLNPQEIQTIQAAPPAQPIPELPSKFFAAPNVVVPPGPQLPIPAGTVLDTRISGGFYAVNVVAGQYIDVRLERALAVGGQTVLPANTHITLKTRVVGPGPRPGTVQIGLMTDRAAMPDGKSAEVKSDELLFTLTKEPNALEGGGIPFDAKLRFTVAEAAVPSAPASPPAPSAPPASALKRLDVVIAVNYSPTPNPAAVEQFEKRIDETTYEIPVTVPDVSDAAFWIARSPDTGGAALSVFSGGKTTLHVGGDITLDQAKVLATKALGSPSKTGFRYVAPSPFKTPALGPRPAKPSPIEQLKFDLTAKAEKGSPKAQFAIGNFYENGIIGPDGIPQPDYPAAAYWYQEASDRGQPEASFALGLLYREGRGMNVNDAAALTQFRKAATAGFVPAMAQLSSAYLVVTTGTSGQRAQMWAREAAKAGDPEGHLNLGFLWYKGWMGGGKPYTYQKAMEEFQLAAQGGDCVAMMNIGGLYFNGDGVPQDKQQAQSWFAKAKTCGGSDLEWMRDKAARYEKKAAEGKLPQIPTPPPGAGLVKLGNSLIAMMSMTLGMDVLAADSEEKLANLSLGEILSLAQKNRKSACALSGFAANMGMSPTAC
jgi:TPR repeat protein